MALVGHIEGEQRGVVGVEILCQTLLEIGEEDLVIGHVLPFLNELVVVVVREEVVVQPQVGVDVLAVIEPVPAGVGACLLYTSPYAVGTGGNLALPGGALFL